MDEQQDPGRTDPADEPLDADVNGAWTGPSPAPDPDADAPAAPPVEVRVVFDVRAAEAAHAVAEASEALGFVTSSIDWLDYREDGDGAITRFAPISTAFFDAASREAAERLAAAAPVGLALQEEPILAPGVEWHLRGVTVFVAPPPG